MSATPTEVDEAPVAQPWHVERDDRVSTIVYRGGRRRTLGISGAAQLAGLLTERSARAEPPVVVLDIGILHAELTEVLEMGAGRPIGDWAPWLAAIDGLDQYPSATIVTIGDQASCGGLELALAADIRIVSPDARLGVLESRMGLIPGAGGTQRLSTLLGRGWASLLCFSGETISGAEAHRIGLAHLIEPDPLRAGGDLAERLSQRGHEVLVAAKRALTAGPQPSKEGLRTEGRAFLSVVGLPSTTASMRDWLRRQAADDPPARDRSMLP